MNKILFLVSLILILTFTSSCIVLADSDNKIKLSYEVIISDYSTGLAKVVMTISNISTNSIKIREFENYGYFNDISELSITDEQNRKLSYEVVNEFTAFKDSKGKEWEINNDNLSKQIKVEYTVNKQKLTNVGIGSEYLVYVGYIGNNVAVFSGEQMFITPSEYERIDENIEVRFNTPDKSNQIFTSWEEIDGVFYPNKDFYQGYKTEGLSTDAISTPIQNLMRSAVAIGDFKVYQQYIGSNVFKVAIPDKFSDEYVEQLGNELFRSYDYFVKLFGDVRVKSYLLIANPETHDKKPIREIGWTTCQTLNMQGGMSYSSSHAFFHTWNGWAKGWQRDFEELGTLITEGFNVYYSCKKDIVVNNDNNVALGNIYENLKFAYEEYKTNKLYQNVGILKNQNESPVVIEWINYVKASLFTMHLDMKIAIDTNYTKSLDDVIKEINIKYRNNNGVADLDGIVEIVNNVSGKNYSDFFKEYLIDNKYMNLDDYFHDSDKDGIPNYVELMRKTNPNKAEVFDKKFFKLYQGYISDVDTYGNLNSMTINTDDKVFKITGKNKFEISTEKTKATNEKLTQFIDKYRPKIVFIAKDGARIEYYPDSSGRSEFEKDVVVQGFGYTINNRLVDGQIYEMRIEPSSRWKIDARPIHVKKLTDKIEIVSTGQENIRQNTIVAVQNKSKVLVNGKEIAFEAYTIEGNNYLKLRDIAFAISGTKKQFSVGYDNEKKAISLTTGIPYTKVGGELAVSSNGTDKKAIQSDAKLYINGKLVTLPAYTINGNNYFKLRDLGKLINFSVAWNGKANTISIDANKVYIE